MRSLVQAHAWALIPIINKLHCQSLWVDQEAVQVNADGLVAAYSSNNSCRTMVPYGPLHAHDVPTVGYGKSIKHTIATT